MYSQTKVDGNVTRGRSSNGYGLTIIPALTHRP